MKDKPLKELIQITIEQLGDIGTNVSLGLADYWENYLEESQPPNEELIKNKDNS